MQSNYRLTAEKPPMKREPKKRNVMQTIITKMIIWTKEEKNYS